jgi:hypothetical protein
MTALSSARPSTRGRALAIMVVGVGGAALLAFVGGSASLRFTSVTPQQGAALGRDPVARVRFFGLPLSAEVSVDGKAVDSQWDMSHLCISAPLGHLADGKHRLRVTLSSALTSVHRGSEFTIDTVPPRLSKLKPATGSDTQESALTLHGKTESGATLVFLDPAGKELERVVAGGDGAFDARIDLADGANPLRIEARDLAGNRSETHWSVFADREAPTLTLVPPPVKVGDPVLAADHASVHLVAHDDDRVAHCHYSLDGGSRRVLKLRRSGTNYVGQIELRDLAEGERVLSVTVADRTGRETEQDWRFIVDSTEEFGRKTMTRGARGKDVETLQKRLVDAKVLEASEVTSLYDDPTVEAVERLQEQQNLAPVDGIAGPAVLGVLGPRIYVDLARFQLVLDRPGQELVRYGIACGMPAHPTPTGRFTVAYKEKNPTWLPPNSVWAKDAKVTPPGPGNPLGTRWIGLSSSEVGIHGTNAAWTIGSRASHGCMRMRIPDVEALYDKVDPGTPVTILSGNETDPILKKYWP